MANTKAKPTIPAWQRADADTSSPPTSPEDQPEEYTTIDEKSLIQQATEFLDHEDVRDRTREEKVAFLESKGIPAEDIENLLPPLQESGKDIVHSSSSVDEPQPSVAPVITYPEFLTRRSKAPPLVTISGLVTTAYAAAAAAAGIYGLSKYVVDPMVSSLMEARHDLAAHTLSRSGELNAKLEGMVSKVPSSNEPSKPVVQSSLSVDTDTGSVDDDPTELFHRDFGTQTSPVASSQASTASTDDSQDSPDRASARALQSQVHDLAALNSHMTRLLDSEASVKSANAKVANEVRDLTSYLQEMAFQSRFPGSYGRSGGLYGNTLNSKRSQDATDAFKIEVRGIKGMLLSARNFPSGAGIPESRSRNKS